MRTYFLLYLKKPKAMLAIDPSGYTVKKALNVLTEPNASVDHGKAARQHKALCTALNVSIVGKTNSEKSLPDMVFVANAGLLLLGLPEKVVLLSNMKHPSRKKETTEIKKIFRALHVRTVSFRDEVFEGQGECAWFFQSKLLVLGVGFRSTKQTVKKLQGTLDNIYNAYGMAAPLVVGLQLTNPSFYHLDIAMCAVNDSECIVRAEAFDEASVRLLKQMNVRVHTLSSPDVFVLNLIPLFNKVVCKKLLLEKDRAFLKKVYQLPLVEVDVGEFEKSGGSVRCMIMSI